MSEAPIAAVVNPTSAPPAAPINGPNGANGPRIGAKAVPKEAPVLALVKTELVAEAANLSFTDISDLSRPLVIAPSSCPAIKGAPKAKPTLLPTFPTPALNFPNFN